MATDPSLFLYRRLGYGPRLGEMPPDNFREWAVAQIGAVPPLDFYGPDGTSDAIRAKLPPEAEPIEDFVQACKVWEVYRLKLNDLQKSTRNLKGREFDKVMSAEMWQPYVNIPRWRDCLCSTLTAVNGPAPVFERFWAFWINHFAVSTSEAEIKLFFGPHTRNIRKRMTGTFAEMLHDAILNPAMLVYLDNWLSTGPNSQQGKKNDGNLNENLAREVLELHTMSPAGGYTQDDVIEAALALTGWQFYARKGTHPEPGDPWGTYFHRYRHEPGSRTIMGKTYKSQKRGANQAPEMLADFAAHAETAKFISWKLARHFVADDPPAEAVERIHTAWVETGGDLVAVHTAVIDAVIEDAGRHEKFSTPQQWLIQCFRLSGVPPPLAQPYPGNGQYWIDALFKELGQSWDECRQPNGWSDLKADWISKEMLDRRLRMAYWFSESLQPADAEPLKLFAEALGGAGSGLALAIQRAPSRYEAATMLLTSPQFLKT